MDAKSKSVQKTFNVPSQLIILFVMHFHILIFAIVFDPNDSFLFQTQSTSNLSWNCCISPSEINLFLKSKSLGYVFANPIILEHDASHLIHQTAIKRQKTVYNLQKFSYEYSGYCKICVFQFDPNLLSLFKQWFQLILLHSFYQWFYAIVIMFIY